MGPPLDITPEQLFRLLLKAPRASMPVELTFAGVDHGAFFAHALHPLEEAAAWHRRSSEHQSVRGMLQTGELAALSLHDHAGERVFADADQLFGLLEEDEARQVVNATLKALGVISPSFQRCDYTAWLARLQLGAAHFSNRPQAHALANCCDIAIGWSGHCRTARPDRYYGVPIGQLTDGQWLAYRAARKSMSHDA